MSELAIILQPKFPSLIVRFDNGAYFLPIGISTMCFTHLLTSVYR